MHDLQFNDWVVLGSLAAVILGWFVNSWRNRINEITKERREYRIEALNALHDLCINHLSKYSLGKDLASSNEDRYNLSKEINQITRLFFFYGTKEEIKLIDGLDILIDTNNIPISNQIHEISNALYNICRKNLRKELKIKPYDINKFIK